MWIPEDMKEDIDYQLSIDSNEDPMIVTYGNPYNPFEDFKGWWKYDFFILGWDVCGILARNTTPIDTETDTQRETDIIEAMRNLVLTYPRLFRIVRKSDYKDPKIHRKILGPYGGAK